MSAGFVRQVTIALEFAPPPEATLPGMADIRFRLEGPASLKKLGLGQPLLDAHKSLAADPQTGEAHRLLADGTTQVLIMSTTSAERIGAGRWLYFDIELGSGSEPAHTPLVMRLVTEQEVLAPPAANEVLFGASVGASVVVWSNDLPPTAEAANAQ